MKLPEKILDANVILRFFLEDHVKQSPRAKAFLGKLELGKDESLLTEIVFAEVVWVLNKVYGVPRRKISETFSKLVSYKGIKTVLDKQIFIESLQLYADNSPDIQDILLSVLARRSGCTVITYDKNDFGKLNCSFAEP